MNESAAVKTAGKAPPMPRSLPNYLHFGVYIGRGRRPDRLGAADRSFLVAFQAPDPEKLSVPSV